MPNTDAAQEDRDLPHTFACREALYRMRNGSVPVGSFTRRVRATIIGRGLAWELTDGQLELSPRGRGVDFATFDA